MAPPTRKRNKMALIGPSTVFVPVGISCQTAFQIDRAKDLLETELDERLEHFATPFDWRIVGPGDVADMIRTNSFYPRTPSELIGNKRPLWPERNCWFWHEKFDDFAKFSSKQAHLVWNWGRIFDARRRVFVVSNTQNNLPKVQRERGGFHVLIDGEHLRRLGDALRAQFGTVELHFVTGEVGYCGQVDPSWAVHRLKRDRSSWHGDPKQWENVLRLAARGMKP